MATVIVRSSTDLRGTLSFLMTSGLLGNVNMEYLNSIEPEEVEDVDFSEPLRPPYHGGIVVAPDWLLAPSKRS